jgi:3-deoxy-D-manno-octulosonate 8-phosphate phosphatase (KDO 8-P phosphatase)
MERQSEIIMNLPDQFKRIRTFVFDVDGVLTDGTVWVAEGKQLVRGMNIKDGYALQLAVMQGYRVVIVSGGNSDPVRVRLENLGITDIHMGVVSKRKVLEEYIATHQLQPEEILFMGDDIPDYRAMEITGLPCAPANAAPEIKQISKYISAIDGGHGCAREVIEKVLKLNDHWPLDTEIPSK